MANSISLDSFVRGVKTMWPGATVWTKGDKAHERSPSDHNNDDTAGSKPEQVDADSRPEVRAADVPTLGGVTMADLDELRVKLTTRPANQRRGRYVILRQDIWRKRNGWKREDYSGDYHGHLHLSIDAADDDNGADWDLDDAPTSSSTPEGDDDEMKIAIANLEGRSTVWTGLRHSGWPLTAESDPEVVSGLVHCGGAQMRFKSAAALVGVTGPAPGKTVAESIKMVEAAG